MDDTEVRALLEDVSDVMKAFVTMTLGPILIRLDAFEKRFDTLPVPKDGKDADVDAIVELVVGKTAPVLEQITAQVDTIRNASTSGIAGIEDRFEKFLPDIERRIPPAIDQSSIVASVREAFTDEFIELRRMVEAIPEAPATNAVKQMIADAIVALPPAVVDQEIVKAVVQDVVAQIPPAPAGRDADPEMIKTMVTEAVAALPPAQDGKDVDTEFVIGTLKAHVDESLTAAIEKLPKPVDGKDADMETIVVTITEKVNEAVAQIPAPKDGVSIDLEVVKTMVDTTVADAIAELPAAKDGKDADPEMMKQLVAAAVAEIPVPKSITVDDVAPMISEEIKTAVAALPVPEVVHGKDADPEMIKQMVTEAVLALPAAKDGTSVTLEDVAPLIVGEVEKAVAQIPAPKDGADGVVDMAAVEEIVKSTVTTAVAALPVPENGKDADPEMVKTLVAEAVEAAVAAIPQAKDGENGKDVDIETVKTLVQTTVTEAVEALPKPVDGKDVDPETVKAMVVETVSSAVAALPSEAELKGFIEEGVAEAVAAIPAAPAGKDADMDLVKSYIDETVAAIPVPVDGKDADPAVIEKMVGEAVAKIEIPAPADGKSVDPAEIKAMVDEAVAKIEPAKDGKDADISVVETLVGDIIAKTIAPEIIEVRNVLDAVIPEVKSLGTKLGDDLAVLVDKAIEQLPKAASIEEIKSIVQETVDAIPPAQAGKDADPELIEQMVANAVVTAVATIPVPKDGVSVAEAVIDNAGELNFVMGDGRVLKMGKVIGKDADPEQIAEMVRSEVAKIPAAVNGKDADPVVIKQLVDEAVATIPAPQPYVPTDDDFAVIAERVAEKIPAPKDGASVTIEDVTPVIEEAVTKAVSAIPAPKDPVGLTGALIDVEGRLVLTLSDGTTKELSTVVGKSADVDAIQKFITDKIAEIKPKDGLDGLSFADFKFDVEHDGERTFTFKWMNHDKEIVRSLTLPITLDRGVYKEGQEYQKGDGVTWAGSYWYAQEATTAKPGDGSKSWRLAVKRGQDGKPGGSPQQPQKTGPLKLR